MPWLALVIGLFAEQAATQQSDPLRLHYERAQSFQRAGDLQRAEAEYRAEVLPRALRRLGNLSGLEGRLDESLELLEAAAELRPDDGDVRVDLAITHLRRRDFAQAAASAEKALAAAPRNARARSALGRALLLRGDPERAAAALRQALADEPRFETAYALALASLRLDRREAARALFDEMLGSARNPDTLVLVGRAYLEAGLATEAISYFSEARERKPTHDLAEDYRRLAQSGSAEPMGTALLELLPTARPDDVRRRAEMRAQMEQLLATAWHNLTVIYTKQGRPDAAADAARRSARWERRPSEADVLHDAALAAAQAGRVEEALAAARRLAELRPADPASRYLLGVALLQNQSWHEAIATLSAPPDAAAAEPQWSAALGMAYFGARDLEAARRAFEATLRLDGSHVEARYHLGLIAREQGRTVEAADELRRAISIAPDHAAAHTELGAVYLLLDDIERARAALERAVALDPEAPAPHYQLGLLFTRIGDTDRARREMTLFEETRAKSLERARRPVIQLPRKKGGPNELPSQAVCACLAAGPRLHAGARADDR